MGHERCRIRLEKDREKPSKVLGEPKSIDGSSVSWVIYLVIYLVGFHSHGATRIAGWLMFGKIPTLFMDDNWGYPVTTKRNPPIFTSQNTIDSPEIHQRFSRNFARNHRKRSLFLSPGGIGWLKAFKTRSAVAPVSEMDNDFAFFMITYDI